jgi:predicted metalloendopeptidase
MKKYTRKNRNKITKHQIKTKKNIGEFTKNILGKKQSILTDKTKPVLEIITETRPTKINNELNRNIEAYFKMPFTKKNMELQKNDFFTYINETWLDELKLDKQLKYLTKIDDFRVTQYKVFEELGNIITEYTTKHNTILSNEINNFHKSALTFNPVSSSKEYLKNAIKYIDELRQDKHNLWKMLAYINKNELTNKMGPFYWEMAPDKKDATKCINYLEPHTFAVFDISIYNPDSNFDVKQKKLYSNRYKKFFLRYLNNLFRNVLTDNERKKSVPIDAFHVGEIFFNLLSKTDPSIKEDTKTYYNIVRADEAYNKYGFDWITYCKELGYKDDAIPDFFVTSNLNYLKFCTETLINEWNSEKWRSFWIWLVARYVARLTDKWHPIYYQFYGKEVKGMEQSIRQSEKQIATIMTAYAFNPVLNNEYINYLYNEDNIVYAKNLAYDLKQIFINKIQRNTWLQPKTRKYAEFKLDKLEMYLGTEKIIYTEENLPLLNFNPNEFLDNMLKLISWRHSQYIKQNRETIQTMAVGDWTQYPLQITNLASYIVNAQYVPYKNALYVSNAYLQNPFINLETHGTQYNLAYLGFTIAHELSHSLDDLGSQYDYKGDLTNWWSKKDETKFKQLQDEIINQYEVFAKYDGLDYDATLTIGEDITDISGLNICEEYLRDYCIANKYTPVINFQYFRMFYAYFAYQMRQKIRKPSVKYELITNPHPIDKYRTNVTLSRSPFFREMFNIVDGDHMYWNNKTGIWD